MPDYSSDLFFSSDYNSHTDRSTFYNSQFCAEHLRPSPPKAKFTPKGPPFIFYFFNKHTKPDVPKGSPFGFFSELCDFFSKFFFRNFFFENKTECLLINPEGSPFYIFRHYATSFERIFFVKNFNFFPKKCFTLFQP